MTVLYILNTNHEIQKSKIKLLLRMGCCFLFLVCLYICVCECLLQTTLRECLRAGLPLGFLSTAPPPVLVSAVLGTLAVWISTQKKKWVVSTHTHIPRYYQQIGSMCHLRECRSIRARRFQAFLLPHTTFVRSCCNCAGCVVAKHKRKKSIATDVTKINKQTRFAIRMRFDPHYQLSSLSK